MTEQLSHTILFNAFHQYRFASFLLCSQIFDKKNFHYMILLHFNLHNVITGPNTSCALSKYLVMASLRKKTLKITKASLDDTNSQYAFNYYIPWSPF